MCVVCVYVHIFSQDDILCVVSECVHVSGVCGVLTCISVHIAIIPLMYLAFVYVCVYVCCTRCMC